MFEIDLGDIGIYDAEIKANAELVRGINEVTIKSVEIVLPILFQGRDGITVNVLPLLSKTIMQDIVEAFLLRYHDGN